MNGVFTADNFISGEVFNEGISNTILKKPTGVEDKERTFLVLYNIENNKIIASSKDLDYKEILFETSENGGGVLTIESIDESNTKSYVEQGQSFSADGFAIIRTDNIIEESASASDGTKLIFPNISDPKNYRIMIKGSLNNNPIISFGSSFRFNRSTINFGIIN